MNKNQRDTHKYDRACMGLKLGGYLKHIKTWCALQLTKTWKIANFPIYSIANSWNERILRGFFYSRIGGVWHWVPHPKNPIVNHVDPHGFDQASDFLEGSAGKRPWKAWFRQLWKWGNHDLSRNGHSTSLNTIIEHLWKWGNTSLKIKLWGKGWKASFLKHLETIYQTKPQFFWFIDTCEHCPKPRDKRKQIPKHI